MFGFRERVFAAAFRTIPGVLVRATWMSSRCRDIPHMPGVGSPALLLARSEFTTCYGDPAHLGRSQEWEAEVWVKSQGHGELNCPWNRATTVSPPGLGTHWLNQHFHVDSTSVAPTLN